MLVSRRSMRLLTELPCVIVVDASLLAVALGDDGTDGRGARGRLADGWRGSRASNATSRFWATRERCTDLADTRDRPRRVAMERESEILCSTA